jgi:hypothetical protein
MTQRARRRAVLVSCLGVAVIATGAARHYAGAKPTPEPDEALTRGGADEAGEAGEEREVTLERLEALAEARAEGRFGEARPILRTAAAAGARR